MFALLSLLSVGAVLAFLYRLLLTAGLAYGAYKGVTIFLNVVTNYIDTGLGALPSNVLAFADMSGLTTLIYWILSAYVFRLTLNLAKPVLQRIGAY